MECVHLPMALLAVFLLFSGVLCHSDDFSEPKQMINRSKYECNSKIDDLIAQFKVNTILSYCFVTLYRITYY